MNEQITAIIVDDEKDITDVFAEYLKIIDVDVLGIGHNGKDAVDLYKRHRPDIVFLDLMMPEYDGLYALENIRADSPSAIVIIITAYMHTANANRLFSLHPTKVISKPWDLNQIYDVVEQFRPDKAEKMQQTK
ncbi:response regulator [Candidatus Nitrosotenuis uzonensis]|uniref:Response regulator receiver protein n=1 Tax=Candidatus Nitrosotenuis uzonensis TaxID=1407055 RepID=V6ARQ2_9ARCH